MDDATHEAGGAVVLMLPVAWAVVILVAGARVLRTPPRARSLVPTRAQRHWKWPRIHPALLLGAVAISWRLGALVPFAAACAAMSLYARHRRIAARRAFATRVQLALPDAADLASVAAAAGATPLAIVDALAQWTGPPVSDAALEVQRRRAAGERLSVALNGLVDTLGAPAAPLVRALVAADRDGTPLAPSLHGVAEQLRADRRRAADVAARRLGVTLLFPLTFCVLPALALVVLAPIVVQIMRSLSI